MHKILSLIKKEKIYFSERISGNIRRIALSNIFRSMSGPLMTTFLNAFIWRVSDSTMGVVVYNLGLFVFLPISFYMNGLLLRQGIHIRKLIAGGAILSGITSALFIFFGSSNIVAIFFYGCIWGLGNGFYWSNRNYLEFQETQKEIRSYFYGFLKSLSSIISVVVPFLAGWFIVLGSFFNIYTQKHAYWLLFIISFIFMFLCAKTIFCGTFKSPVPNKIILKTTFLNKRRILNIASGFTDGTPFTVTLLILMILGNEGILGSITAIMSLITAFITYEYSKRIKLTSGPRALIIFGVLFFISTCCLIIFPLKIGIILYITISGISLSFISILLAPILLLLSEEEISKNNNSNYSFIFDNEAFLNIGRILSLFIIIGLTFLTSEIHTLIYGQIFISILFVISLSIFSYLWKIKKRTTNIYN